MSFQAPAVLIALVGLPLVALWYGTRQRERRRAAAIFARPALQPSVAPKRPGWRRHAPMLALLGAAAVLVLAAARAAVTGSLPLVDLPSERSTMAAGTRRPPAPRALPSRRVAVVIASPVAVPPLGVIASIAVLTSSRLRVGL